MHGRDGERQRGESRRRQVAPIPDRPKVRLEPPQAGASWRTAEPARPCARPPPGMPADDAAPGAELPAADCPDIPRMCVAARGRPPQRRHRRRDPGLRGPSPHAVVRFGAAACTAGRNPETPAADTGADGETGTPGRHQSWRRRECCAGVGIMGGWAGHMWPHAC